jgi:hypothetical protein
MSATLQRLHVLALELEQFVLQLGERTAPATAALFIDRLHRCAGYDDEQRRAVGAQPLFERAWAAWLATRDALGEHAGRGLDVEALLDRADALLADEADESVQDWAADLLLVAGVTPWVPGDRGARMGAVLDDCLDLVQAWPEHFHPAALEALDRYEYEFVPALPPATRAVLAGLRELPLLAVVDASGVAADAAVVERLLTSTRAPSPAWTPVLHRAEEALQDAAEHAGNMAAFVARAADQGMIHAAAAGEDEGRRLGWRCGMEFLLLLDGPDLFVATEGPRAHEIVIVAHTHQGTEVLTRSEHQGEQRWHLPNPTRWPAAVLRLELRLGPDSWVFELPSPEPRS